MSTTVRVDMKPVNTIVNRLGLGKSGDVQKFVTGEVNRRITKYMPYRTGMLSTKLKFIKSPTEIVVNAPYARYLYYGKVMVDAATGKGPAYIPGVGFRFKKGAKLKATDRDLEYTKPGLNSLKGHPLAGPKWEKRMMAAEGRQLAADTQKYIDRKRRNR